MSKVLFSKFSRERKREYQIVTSIVEADGEKAVLKRALSEEAKNHLQNITKYYELLNQNYFLDSRVQVCPCKSCGDDAISFSFVKGETLEEQMKYHIEQGDFENLLEDVRLLSSIITNVQGRKKFEKTAEFIEVFGDIELPENLEAAEISNVDMIADNLLLDEAIHVVDYEWVFLFPVPFSFIIFRSLFHSAEISRLSDEKMREVYQVAGVDLAQCHLYFQMELAFQKQVSGEVEVLADLYKKMGRQCYLISDWKMNPTLSKAVIVGKRGKETIVLTENQIAGTHIQLETRIEESAIETFAFYPLPTNCILKILSIKGYQGEKESLLSIEKQNAKLVIGDDYYFTEAPCIMVENQTYDKVLMDYQILSRDEGMIAQRVADIEKIAEEKQKNQNLTQEMQEIKNTKVWKAYMKYRKLRERNE